MQPERPTKILQRGEQKSSRQSQPQAQFPLVRWLVSPFLNSAQSLRRRTLVSNLFKHVKEIHSINHGYTLRFDWSDDLQDLDELIGKIASYIVFESRNTPQLTFAIVEEPQSKTFCLQVQSLEGDVSNARSAYMSFYPSPSHRVSSNQDNWKGETLTAMLLPSENVRTLVGRRMIQ